MTTAVVCPEPALGERLRRAVGGHRMVVPDVSAASRSLKGVRAVVVMSPALTEAAAEALRRLADELPAARVVLITEPRPMLAKLLLGVSIDELIWCDEWPKALPRALTRLSADGVVGLLSRAILRHAPLVGHPHLPRALAEACSRAPPVPSVPELAQMACLSTSTLRRRVRETFGPTCTPKALLESIGTLVAVDLMEGGVRVNQVGPRLGVRTRTVQRCVRARAGAPLTQIRTEPDAALQRVLQALGLLEAARDR